MRLFPKLGIAVALIVVSGGGISATEVAVLRNGFTIRHERREQAGDMTRLYLAEAPGSYVDVPTDQVVGFEADDYLPPAQVLKVIPAPAPALGEVVRLAAGRNKIDPALIMSVIRTESAFRANAVSAKGARGLMQLMPQTALQLGVMNPLDPIANVEGGTLYLRQLLDRYNNDLVKALAAYNAGPERVDQYGGVPPYAETRAYVTEIVRDFNRQKLAERRVAAAPGIGQKGSPASKTDASSSRLPILPGSGTE
jgi:soluble lytic murein transglycosylase-like protein